MLREMDILEDWAAIRKVSAQSFRVYSQRAICEIFHGRLTTLQKQLFKSLQPFCFVIGKLV